MRYSQLDFLFSCQETHAHYKVKRQTELLDKGAEYIPTHKKAPSSAAADRLSRYSCKGGLYFLRRNGSAWASDRRGDERGSSPR